MYKRKACSPRVMMKIDLQKAYDSVEWSFLNDMLITLKFPESIIRILMQCVTTPSYSLSLNGELFGFFKDDLLMFCRGDIGSVVLMLRAFLSFSQASGLQMNKGKSNIYSDEGDEGTMYQLVKASAIVKYAWLVSNKTDHLWVRWVHSVYIKEQDWIDYKPGQGSSWAWRKVCWAKDLVKQHLFAADNYSIKLGYSWLTNEGPDISWHPWTSTRLIIPRHGFIVWLTAHKRLLTQDRLVRMGIIQTNVCFLCGCNAETVEHLFFLCPFSSRCLELVAAWLNISLPDQGVIEWWVKQRARSLLLKQVIAVVLASLIYHIWMSRNKCRIEGSVPHPQQVVKYCKDETLMRIKFSRVESKILGASTWISSIVK
ncbi:uncharacterized protein LOC141608256 [Silene latifolia]|uniref:uncharacterized protein LOC141608256 n=1 Tax=Silene latifolia TaxID=37657 RepID=UPI003D77D0F8